jgi:hypothetical protein
MNYEIAIVFVGYLTTLHQLQRLVMHGQTERTGEEEAAAYFMIPQNDENTQNRRGSGGLHPSGIETWTFYLTARERNEATKCSASVAGLM